MFSFFISRLIKIHLLISSVEPYPQSTVIFSATESTFKSERERERKSFMKGFFVAFFQFPIKVSHVKHTTIFSRARAWTFETDENVRVLSDSVYLRLLTTHFLAKYYFMSCDFYRIYLLFRDFSP